MSATGTLITIGSIAGIYALLALALNIKFGETGILDFGHIAYFLVGAYTAALIIMPPPESFDLQNFLFGLHLDNFFIELTGMEIFGGLGWVIAIIVAIVAAGFLGLVVSLPTIRLRADYLAIALLGVSVITWRTVQSEGWLVNGPDNLRGYSRPFSGVFPIPEANLDAAILTGLVVMLVWLMILVLLVRCDLVDNLEGSRKRVVDGALWILTLGGGFWAVRRIRGGLEESSSHVRRATHVEYVPLYAVTGVYGLVTAALTLAGLGSEAIMLFFGIGSLLLWVVIGLKVREHYREYDRRSALAGLAVAMGFVVAILPTNLLVDADITIAYAAAFVSFGLLAAYGYGLYRAYDEWERFDIPGNYLGILGIGLLWILAFRYFVVPVYQSGSVASMVTSTQENIFWLIDFDLALGPSINYRRFLFFLVIAAVMASYFMLEALRRSPYGRVMRAIRDDENVAMSLGKNTFYFKVQAMVIGGAFAGLAGALGAVYYRSMGYTLFNPLFTFFIFLAVILGGKANNKGVILGAVFYWLLVRGTTELADMFPGAIGGRMEILRNAIIGLLLVLVLYYKPEGVWAEERTIEGVQQ